MPIPHIPKHSPCMAKLDKLHWVDGLSFQAYGVSMGIRVSRADMLAKVAELLPPGAVRTEEEVVKQLVSFEVGGPGARPGIKRFHMVYAGVGRMARTHDLDEALHAVESSAQLLMAMSAPDRVFIHAGVVGWKGRAILLPGRSFAGKSTLVMELLKQGADYYSDEYAILDNEGNVYPYPRRLSMRNGEEIPRVRPTAEELGAKTGSEPLKVGLIAVSRYREGSRWNPTRVKGAKAALTLLDNAVAARKAPERCLQAIEPIAQHAPCVIGQRGEAAEMASALLASI